MPSFTATAASGQQSLVFGTPSSGSLLVRSVPDDEDKIVLDPASVQEEPTIATDTVKFSPDSASTVPTVDLTIEHPPAGSAGADSTPSPPLTTPTAVPADDPVSSMVVEGTTPTSPPAEVTFIVKEASSTLIIVSLDEHGPETSRLDTATDVIPPPSPIPFVTSSTEPTNFKSLIEEEAVPVFVTVVDGPTGEPSAPQEVLGAVEQETGFNFLTPVPGRSKLDVGTARLERRRYGFSPHGMVVYYEEEEEEGAGYWND